MYHSNILFYLFELMRYLFSHSFQLLRRILPQVFMIDVKYLYDAAARSGLLVEAIWAPDLGPMVVTWVEFRAPDTSILDGLGVSTDYTMRYPASCLVGLKQGDRVEIGGAIYRVREVRAVGDGSESRATLTCL